MHGTPLFEHPGMLGTVVVVGAVTTLMSALVGWPARPCGTAGYFRDAPCFIFGNTAFAISSHSAPPVAFINLRTSQCILSGIDR